MTTTCIVYHSVTSTTARLAEAIYAGAAEIGTAALLRITGDQIVAGRFRDNTIWAQLEHADAIIFGSPTFMGGPSAQFKAFADASSDLWCDKKWSDKVASGFTVGSNLNGDQFCTLSSFSVLAAQHGMLWCGLDIPGGHDSLGRNTLGTQLGLAIRGEDGVVAEIDLLTARYLGARVARIAKRLKLA